MDIPAFERISGVVGRGWDIVAHAADFVRTSPLRLGAIATVACLNTSAYRTNAYPRDTLPEPFDWPDHIGNITPSLVIGALASACVVRAAERFVPHASSRAVRCAMVAGALAAGTAVNYAVESGGMEAVIGSDVMNFIFEGRTNGDIVDAAYGSIAAGAGSAAIKTRLGPILPANR